LLNPGTLAAFLPVSGVQPPFGSQARTLSPGGRFSVLQKPSSAPSLPNVRKRSDGARPLSGKYCKFSEFRRHAGNKLRPVLGEEPAAAR
jgi:hypothetical protein